MQKIIFSFLIWLGMITANPVRAQNKAFRFGHGFVIEEVSTDTRFMVRQASMNMAPEEDISYTVDLYTKPKKDAWAIMADRKPKSPIILASKLDSNLTDYWSGDVRSISKNYATYSISDSSEALLIALGIDNTNYMDYRYHVVVDDSIELVRWAIPMLEKKYGAKKPYGFLGKFCQPGRQVMVEVVNTKNYGIRDGVIYDWRRNFKPKITQAVVVGPNNSYFNITYRGGNRGYATRYDPNTDLPMDLHFPVDSVDLIRFEFAGHETVPYVFQLIRENAGKKDTTMLKWWSTDAFFDLEKKDMSTPGHYELIIQRAHFIDHPDERQLLRIPFEVQPPPALEKKISLRQLLPYILGAIAFIGLAFFAFYRINKRRLRVARQNSETIGLQLKSIQSQLNPHFMFNALAAIQSLMNKKDIDGANHYLAKFADLTRDVLHTADAEMISLEDELKILDDYLQMEQLRFGFSYDLDIASDINRANTEIPVMLLQPFVENAVKHGVSGLHNEGRITITVSRKEINLILQIADNGKGFDKKHSSDAGYGLKLSAQRIVLLNQRYKAGRIALDLDSGAAGTIVTIKLDHWL